MHPYLKRRTGQEEEKYLHEIVKETLKRTLGVPLFQEQMLKMSMDMAGFTGSEAEELRRALSFHRSHERMEKVCVKLRQHMVKKGHTPKVVDDLVKAVQSFA